MNVVYLRPNLIDLQLKLLDVLQEPPFDNLSIVETLGVIEMVKFELLQSIEE